MAIDFNTTPYYDDFDEDKNFHRILFRPGRAVQARELTQSQTILQDQVTKFGDHIFKDGSKVSGAELFGVGEGKIDKITINLQPSINHINLAPINPVTNTQVNVASFINGYITVPITGIGNANAVQTATFSNTVAKNIFFVHHADAAANGDPDTLYVSHIKSANVYLANGALDSVNANSNIALTLANVTVTANATMNVYTSLLLDDANLITQVTANANPYGDAKLLGVTEGVFYTSGLFVKNQKQIVAADKYGKTANVSIGFEVTESVVDSSTDSSLLDPALDSSNYLATGADRYKVSLTLTRKQLDDATKSIPDLSSTKYIELARYKNGQLVKDTSKTKYSDLGRTLARRTYDESGDYIVRGLEPRVSNLGNSSTGILTVGKGKAYAKGYELDKISDENINLPKARDTETVDSYSLEQYYGNFVYVHQANSLGFLSFQSSANAALANIAKVSFHSSNIANGGASSTTTSFAQNTKIGEAHVRNIEWVRNENGNGGGRDGNIYKLSLFNIRNTSNVPLSAAKTIVAVGVSNSLNANANIHSTSIQTHRTPARLANGTNNMIVVDASGIKVGDLVEGHNVSNNGPVSAGNTGSASSAQEGRGKRIVFVKSVSGTNVELSCTVFSGTTTDLGDGFLTNSGSNNYTFSRTIYGDANEDSLVFPTSYKYITSGGAETFAYQTRSLFESVDFTSGVGSITSTAGKTFIESTTAALRAKNYQLTITASGTAANPAGLQFDMSDSGASVSLSANSLIATIDIGDGSFSGTANVLATLSVTNGEADKRVLTPRRVFRDYAIGTHTQRVGTKTEKISLGRPYVLNVEAIYISDGDYDANNTLENVRDAFIFDTGQREGFFDHGTIRLRANNTIANGYADTAKINVGRMNVVFNHVESNGTGFIDSSRYSSDKFKYESVPQFTKKDGTIISLRDAIDFRPYRVTDNTPNVYSNNNMIFSGIQIPDSEDTTATMKLNYFLPRNDKLVLGFDGNFRIIEGESALNDPPIPADDPDSITIAKLGLEAYTAHASNVRLDVVNNKGYTMKDIKGLDDRITRVEYYTSLNLLESELASSTFFSNNNVELLSNGFVVDPFRGHSVGDVANPDYKCSIDYSNGTLRPRFKANGASALEGTTKNLRNTGGRLTLDFGSEVYTAQGVATGTINVNPFNVVGFVGHVKLTTDVATYADFDSRPFTAINTEGNSDNFEYGENYTGSRWSEWDLMTFDRSDAKVFTYYDSKNQKIRTTTSAEEAAAYNTKTETDKVYFYAQAQNIDFEIYGYKPNTPVKAFIDNRNVSDRLSRFDSDTSSYTNSVTIVSDDNGFAKGRIKLPNNPDTNEQFLAGEHQIIFCDAIVNPTFHTTLAATTYFSGSPRVVEVEDNNDNQREVPPEPASYDCDFYWDQVNQNPDCITITQKNNDLINREGLDSTVVNNWGPIIYSIYQSVLQRKPDKGGYGFYLKQINNNEIGSVRDRSNDAQARGIIEQIFRSSPEYSNIQQGVYVDPLAQTFFVNEFTNPKGIFVPSISVFFATKDPSLPVTLEIRKTVNGYPSSKDIILGARVTKNPADVNTPTEANTPVKTQFDFDKPIFLEPGEYSIVLLTNSSNYTVFIATVGQTRIDNGQVVSGQPYTGSLFKSQNATTWEPDQLSDLSFEIRKCAFDTSGSAFTDIDAQIGNLPTQYVDYMKVSAPYETYSDKTTLSFELGTTANGDSSMSKGIKVYPEADINFETRKQFTASAEANLRVRMSTTDADVSPTFDLDSCRFIFAENLIESSANTTVTDRPETLNEAGGAQSKYITKKVKLADDFDATGLRVILAKNLPEGSSIQVYYRVQSAVDSSEFDNLPYTEMTQYTPSVVSQNYTDYYDCEYRADEITYENATSTYDNFRYFQIKVVFHSTNTSKVPTVKNFRAIALS